MNSTSKITAEVKAERWLLKEPFVISRGLKTHAETVRLSISDGQFKGWGECQPNSRYGETQESVVEQLISCFPSSLQELKEHSISLKSIAARNALDCALWDLRAKVEAGRLVGDAKQDKTALTQDVPVETYFTLSVGSPVEMAEAAKKVTVSGGSRLKLKFAGEGDKERLLAVRQAAPTASVIIDANEAWSTEQLRELLPLLEECRVDLLEQPLPADDDEYLREVSSTVRICADESCHTIKDLDGLVGKYDVINIKLDKTGGLTHALALSSRAKELGFKTMVGCMLGTSLAAAPALLVAASADFVDMDAPLLLASDRDGGFEVSSSLTYPTIASKIWGAGV